MTPSIAMQRPNVEGLVALACDAVRAITWPQIRGAMLFGLAATAFTTLIHVGAVFHIGQTIPLDLFLLGGAISDQIKAACLLVAIVMADRAVDEGARRRRAYVIAGLVGCLVGVAVGAVFDWGWRTFILPDRWPETRPWNRGTAALVYAPVFALMNWLLIGGAGVFFYADRRAARKTAARLQAAELDRIRRSKLALESRLQAMQARVEPQFLFNTLTQVEKLYDADPGRARRMLDDLIVYLRAALPLIRESTSTLGKEIDLARAYLNIVKVRLGERLTYDIALSDDADDVRIPPMVLLPLIDHAIVYGLEPSHEGGSIRIATSISEGRLRLTVLDSGAGFVEAGPGIDGIQAIRDRLDALYGREAQLVLKEEASRGTRAVMEIPCERSERPERIAPLGASTERAPSSVS